MAMALLRETYFQQENVSPNVLHLQPIKNGHGSVCPHPIHDCSQLEQEGNSHETFEKKHVGVVKSFTQEISQYSCRVTRSDLIGR